MAGPEELRLVEVYLEARYKCTALAARARREGLTGLASRLKPALDTLCGEIRELLVSAGLDRAPARFDPALLGEPLESLERKCREAAVRAAASGSRAARLLLDAAGRGLGEG
ncbi:MAG: hypothetical protein LRS49_06375 [Desulfurococcales archaeon]|nr:hypothetical protein [Desulfurococcales archaeon]